MGSVRSPVARRSQGFVSLGLVGVLSAGLVVAALGSGVSRSVVRLGEGGAWLAGVGVVSHVNGASAQVDGEVRVDGLSGELQVVTTGEGTFVFSPESHRLVRVSRGSDAVDTTVDLVGSETFQRLVSGPRGVLWLVDPAAGVVQRVDPVTLRSVGRQVRVGSRDLGQAAVDDSGVLWVPSGGDGRVVGVRGDRVVARVSAGIGSVSVGVVAGRAVVVHSRGWVRVVGVSGLLSPRIDLRVSGELLVPERTAGRVVPVWSPGSGRVAVVDIEAGSVRRVIKGPVVGENARAPVIVKGHLLVGDPENRQVRIWDTKTGTERPSEPFDSDGGPIEFVVVAGLVYVNDPTGNSAAVYDPAGDGSFRTLNKTAYIPPTPKPPDDKDPSTRDPTARPGPGGRTPVPPPLPGATTTTTGGNTATAGIPDPPTGIVYTAGDRSVTATFDPVTGPAARGATITGYQLTCAAPPGEREDADFVEAKFGDRPVQWMGGAAETVGAESPLELDGLANGIRFACSLSALVRGGSGEASGAASVTPVGPPRVSISRSCAGCLDELLYFNWQIYIDRNGDEPGNISLDVRKVPDPSDVRVESRLYCLPARCEASLDAYFSAYRVDVGPPERFRRFPATSVVATSSNSKGDGAPQSIAFEPVRMPNNAWVYDS